MGLLFLLTDCTNKSKNDMNKEKLDFLDGLHDCLWDLVKSILAGLSIALLLKLLSLPLDELAAAYLSSHPL